ncbi:MAG: hypothetical protein WCP03_04255, partial [Candidatus Saccharibacteria bacterium]
MEEQPNNQPQQSLPEKPMEAQLTVVPKPQKAGNNTLLITVVLIAVMALIAVGATWYYMNSKQKDQQSNNQNQIDQLKSEASALKDKVAITKPSTTPTPTPTATKNDLEVLKAFCKSIQPNSTIDPVIYYQGTSGNFGKCGLDGGQIITAYVNNAWVKVYEGNGVFEDSLCVKYKIPYSIMTSCKGS